ncbi:MAG: FAD-dependent oxidoreductase [Planctomycetaceae bacterium]|nr:FAD-dependent oxidoreductase [Planctomycetaceae bacterium]
MMADAEQSAAGNDPLASRAPLQVVLIGAGHAHLQVVEWWRRRSLPGVELILLSAFDRAAYSGMLPGCLAGMLSPREFMIDLPALTARCGVKLIVDRAVALDPGARVIACAHHPSVSYDIASINIGSVPQAESLCQTHRSLISVKPLLTFVDRLDKRIADWQSQQQGSGATAPLRLAVVGAGAAGIELALCLSTKLRKQDIDAEVFLIDAGRELWRGASRGAQRYARRALERSRTAVWLGKRVMACDEDGPTELVLEDGVRRQCDLAVWATGAAPHAVAARFGLPTTDSGFLAVRPTMQSTGVDDVFVVGDAAEMSGVHIPKAGVYAVRQGAVLFENIRRLIAGKPLTTYRPQAQFLSLLACGDGTAIVDYRGWACRSRSAWRLKLWIDRSFVKRFQ